MSINYKVIQERLFRRIHRTGEEIKNDFPNILRTAVETEAWKHFKKPNGNEFSNLGEWLTFAFPNGVSMGKEKTSISYEDALQLVAHDRELHGLLVKHRPSKSGPKGGRPKKETLSDTKGLSKAPTPNSRAYIEQRLQKDHPKVWEEYIAGNIKSARQAGIKAGFIRDTHDPLMRLKAYWAKATNRQKKEFLKWVEPN